ncbi:hypothetical protein V8C44DRAFT_333260 [Trichoderma aethiopicum]
MSTSPWDKSLDSLVFPNLMHFPVFIVPFGLRDTNVSTQQCSRYWPCRHCGTRRVANDCVFQSVLEVKAPEERQAKLDELAAEMEGACFFSQALNEELDGGNASTVDDFEALGYSSAHAVSSCSFEQEEQQE